MIRKRGRSYQVIVFAGYDPLTGRELRLRESTTNEAEAQRILRRLTAQVDEQRYVDITDTFDRKIAALRAHVSQVSHPDSLVERMRERLAPNTGAAGLPEGRYAEVFQVVLNR
jgi:LmbE family N-acetylglucosaminyl deacetylase